MAKANYKGTVLTGPSTYRAWRAMFVAECKSEKLWKYIDGSAIVPDKDPWNVPSPPVTEEGNSRPAVEKAAVEAWLEAKEIYEHPKNVPVVEKHEAMLNLNAEIRVQNAELAFHDAHLINFLPACPRPLKE
ncbi:hypothetical protein MMC07_000620 [Pseudocyphellaria aurata]|nr:hypothetical protein [Pseudocyphellaria aurata]